LQRSVYHYEPRPNADGPIVKLLVELAWQLPERGFGKLFKRLRRQGHGWNHKRVYRIYCSSKLNKKRKGKRRLPTRCPAPIVTIPTNVDWKKRGTRTRVFYTVEFASSTDRKLGKKKGACWENELKTCASQIVKQAKIAARKLTG
jgi:hypothetical protein